MALTLKTFDQSLAVGLVKKGQDYYQKQAVRELENVGDNTWIAFVDGTETYEVTLTLNGKRTVTEHACDCPVDDPVCKHQVAVFFALREQLAQEVVTAKDKKMTGATPKKKADLFDSVLDDVSDEDLRAFVRHYAQKHKDFKNDLLIRFSDRSEGVDKAHYVEMLKQMRRSAADRSGFIEYTKARQYSRQVDALLKQARTMSTNRNFRGAVAIAQAVLEQVSEAVGAMDDSAGGAGSNLSLALDLLKQSYEQAGAPELKREIFDYLIGQVPESRYRNAGIDDNMLDLLDGLCEYPEQDQAYEQLLDRLQTKLPEQAKVDKIRFLVGFGSDMADWNWDEQRLIERRMKLYERRGRPAEARVLLEAHAHLRPFRERLLNVLLAEKQFDRAKQLVQERLQALQPALPAKGKRQPMMDGQLPRQQVIWYDWLLKIAQLEGDTDRIREYAEWLFRQSGYSHLGYYRLLKKTYPPDEQAAVATRFMAECEQDKNPIKGVFSSLAGGLILAHNLANLYEEEGQWDKLMTLVEQKGTLNDVMQYDRPLAERFPGRLLDTYWRVINKFAEEHIETSAYKTVADVLRRMKQLPGGPALVAEIVADYQTRYVRRRKMMDALQTV